MALFQLTCLCSTNEFNKTLLLQNCTGALWGNMIQIFFGLLNVKLYQPSLLSDLINQPDKTCSADLRSVFS